MAQPREKIDTMAVDADTEYVADPALSVTEPKLTVC